MSVYYTSAPVSPSDLVLMRRLEELHLTFPFAGSRMLRDLLNREGVVVGRKHVATLMKRMGVEALYRKPNTRRYPAHPVYPYLLRNLDIRRANHVWAMDICYIPLARGFVYLCAVVDGASRKILSHRVSISLDTVFCLDALEAALARPANPRSSTPTRAANPPVSPSPTP